MLSDYVLECQHAKSRKEHQHAKNGKEQNGNEADNVGGHGYLKQSSNIQNSKKFDCPARIKMIDVVTFPDLKIDQSSMEYDRKKIGTKLRKVYKQRI